MELPAAKSSLDFLIQHAFGDHSPKAPALEAEANEIPALGTEIAGRYIVHEELGRGGIGIVVRARDLLLARDVALKVLRTRHLSSTASVERFLEEARIAAQLEHPGIVPVHDMGTLDDGRPFLAMKRVEGRTFASVLGERCDPGDRLAEMLDSFERVCQTVAYAHARGVIHRDLKPSNVMLGRFGEVVVTDWGLARWLDAAREASTEISEGMERIPGLAPEREPDARSAALSTTGAVIGSPAFMAPEQARGRRELVGRASDVFALGGILCEILTARTPYQGTRDVALLQARLGDTRRALAALRAAHAPRELVDLAIACLEIEVERRPADAAALAAGLRRYREAREEHARSAELAAARAAARADAERRTRRIANALYATLLGCLTLGASGWWMFQRASRDREDRTSAAVDAAIEEGRRRWSAAAESSSIEDWQQVLLAAERASATARSGDAEPRTRVRAVSFEREAVAALERVRAARRREERRLALEARLEGIHERSLLFRDWGRTADEYASFFAELGFDPALPESEFRLGELKPAILVPALDDWVAKQRMARGNDARAERIEDLADRFDGDEIRARIRALPHSPDPAELAELASIVEAEVPAPETAILLSRRWPQSSLSEKVQRLLLRAHLQRPSDLALIMLLADRAQENGVLVDALRFSSAAMALRPDWLPSRFQVHRALILSERREEANFLGFALAAAHPEDPLVAFNVGVALLSSGFADRALPLLELATALRPRDARAAQQLAQAHRRLGDPERAAAGFRAAAELDPEFSDPWLSWSAMLCDDLKRYEEALEVLENLAVFPAERAKYFRNRAVMLSGLGRSSEAIAALRSAVEVAPDAAEIHELLARELFKNQDPESALDSARRAVALEPRRPEPWFWIGNLLSERGEREGAILAWRMAIAARHGIPPAWYNLGLELVDDDASRGEAIAAFREAVRQHPAFMEAHIDLARALMLSGKLDEASESLDTAARLQPENERVKELRAEIAERRR
ncbi:MAG: protein kinase [Planctomycetes bacterium]|nr:protein kinase [Planctomycetota bacterium]